MDNSHSPFIFSLSIHIIASGRIIEYGVEFLICQETQVGTIERFGETQDPQICCVIVNLQQMHFLFNFLQMCLMLV